eukprot:5815572-Amphidinium_carterae.1
MQTFACILPSQTGKSCKRRTFVQVIKLQPKKTTTTGSEAERKLMEELEALKAAMEELTNNVSECVCGMAQQARWNYSRLLLSCGASRTCTKRTKSSRTRAETPLRCQRRRSRKRFRPVPAFPVME